MAVRTKIEPIDRDIELMLRDLSPEAQSAGLAKFAGEQRDEALADNRRALGSVPGFDTFVDGRRGAVLEQVRPDGVIIFEFHLMTEVFGWIDLLLIRFSPVGKPPKDRHPGLYRRSVPRRIVDLVALGLNLLFDRNRLAQQADVRGKLRRIVLSIEIGLRLRQQRFADARIHDRLLLVDRQLPAAAAAGWDLVHLPLQHLLVVGVLEPANLEADARHIRDIGQLRLRLS